MAEGWVKKLKSDDIEPYSAGIETHGLNSNAVKVMAEAGVDISGHRSKHVDELKGIEFDYVRTDFEPNPGSGYVFGSELEYKYRNNESVIPGQIPPSELTSAGVKTAVYFPLKGRMVAASAFQGWGIVSANGATPADEYRYIGGLRDLRGFTEQQFPAYRYMILTFEPRLKTGQYSRIYFFGDFGFIKGSREATADYKFKPGYGFGLVSGSGTGQLKLEIAWGDRTFPSGAVLNFGVGGKF